MFGPDPIGLIRQGLALLAAEERVGWSGAARSARLTELVEVGERLQAETLRCTGEWDAQADWALDGALSPRSWLAHRTPLSRLQASRTVSAARLCRRHEATGAALAEGAISCAHVEVLAPMARGREEEFAASEEVLLDAARDLRADAFTEAARHWRNIVDDHQDSARMLDRRGLGIATTLSGMGVIEGELDQEGTETVIEALDLAAPPDRADVPEPPRTLRQRRADGLVDVCRAFLESKGRGGRGHAGASLVIDHDTAAGHVGAQRDPRDVRCELSRTGPVPIETARRLLCDCEIGRVVVGPDGEILDLGRKQRTPSPAQRRALVVRDRGCVWPGCDRPAEWCDAHHLVWWDDGGSTDLDNLVLLCRRHHMLCHEGGWTMFRAPDGTVEVKEPPATRSPRGRTGRAPPDRAG
jgi:hypothetical protein